MANIADMEGPTGAFILENLNFILRCRPSIVLGHTRKQSYHGILNLHFQLEVIRLELIGK
jgi:hypothetical protein